VTVRTKTYDGVASSGMFITLSSKKTDEMTIKGGTDTPTQTDRYINSLLVLTK